MKPPADEIDRRRPVWEAMSEFFLDTQLDAADHARIADVLAGSEYSISELDRILWMELCPVLWANLACAAGEWTGFDMSCVEGRILSHRAGVLRRWWCYMNGGKIARHDWQRVRDILGTRRNGEGPRDR